MVIKASFTLTRTSPSEWNMYSFRDEIGLLHSFGCSVPVKDSAGYLSGEMGDMEGDGSRTLDVVPFIIRGKHFYPIT